MLPAETRDPFAVLDWIVSRQVHAYLDTAGRPVGEGRSSVFQQVQTELRTCPFPGSRYHHEKPMNASAIQGMPPWPDLLALMSWLSHRHRERYGVGVTNSHDLARITSAGIMLVDYLSLRQDHPVRSREVPLLVSGVYKVCLGYQLAYLPERFAEEDAPAELPDAGEFLEYLEEAGLLIGEAEVCSCPPAMILQSYEAMTRAQTGIAVPQIDGLSIDWDRFDDFAEGAGDMWREMVMFAIRMPSLIPQFDRAELPDQVKDRLNTLLLKRGTQLLEARDGLVVAVAESVRGTLGTITAPLPAHSGMSGEIRSGTVAATLVEWLRGEAPDEMAAYGPYVEGVLQLQLGPYEDYETGVLKRINRNLDSVMKALDLAPGPILTPASLSQICGRTMRDWAIQ
jgi:hypothetical protein